MAATYYAQLLREYYWDKISAAMDYGASLHRNGLQELREDQPKDELVSEGSYNEISVWAGCPTYYDNPDGFVTMIYIGSIFSIFPSGKFYMPWSTNVTETEARKDEAYREAFDKAAFKYNMYLENGEGDPTDLFLVRYYEWE